MIFEELAVTGYPTTGHEVKEMLEEAGEAVVSGVYEIETEDGVELMEVDFNSEGGEWILIAQENELFQGNEESLSENQDIISSSLIDDRGLIYHQMLWQDNGEQMIQYVVDGLAFQSQGWNFAFNFILIELNGIRKYLKVNLPQEFLDDPNYQRFAACDAQTYLGEYLIEPMPLEGYINLDPPQGLEDQYADDPDYACYFYNINVPRYCSHKFTMLLPEGTKILEFTDLLSVQAQLSCPINENSFMWDYQLSVRD